MADKPVEAVALTDSERLDRLENAVATGLNVDLGQFDTPEHQAQNKAAADQAAADELAKQQADAEAAAAAAATPPAEAPPAEAPPADPASVEVNTQVSADVAAAPDPQTAVAAVQSAGVSHQDELAHLEAALVKFPDDPDILAAKADVEAEIAAENPPAA